MARTFAKHDVRTLIDSFEFYEDEKRMISFVRARLGDLEQVMQADRDDPELVETQATWDREPAE